MSDFKELRVWQLARETAVHVYRITSQFPAEERFELVRQIRRAASSIPANIAESRGRFGAKDQRQFLQIAQGSTRELESHLLLARDLGYVADDECATVPGRVEQIGRMLSSLIGRRM